MKPSVWISSMLVGLMKEGKSGTEEHSIHGGKAPATGASPPSCTNMGCPLSMYAGIYVPSQIY